jgi:uncharacterized protein (DUF885 family)
VKFLAAGALAAALTLSLAAEAQPTMNAHAQGLHALFSSEWERSLRDNPEAASYQGDTRHDDRWTDMSRAGIAQREQAERDALAKLRAIPRAQLSAADQLHHDTFEWQLQLAVDRQRFQEWLQPIGHQGGVQTADGIAQTMPLANTAQVRQYLARMAAVPTLVAQTVRLMREGLKAGRMPPKVLMQRVPAQIRAQIVADATQSPFYAPLRSFKAGVPQADRAALQAEAQQLILTRLVPAYRELLAVFEGEYLPKARDTIAATAQPDGDAYYALLVRSFTSTPLTPREIHDIGLAEVARLDAAMEKTKNEAGFKGSMAEFFHFLRTDQRFFAKTPEELLRAYRDVSKRIDPELVKISKTLPRMPYGVRPIPDNIAPDTTTAYYQGGAADGLHSQARPGYYYVNLYKPETRPSWEMMALSLHEAVPGHHLQFARALELPDMPVFRKTAYFVAYGEGWALYAEQLGYDMGLYDDPYERFGQLTYEQWRAVRLVVDTGMHAFGWTRQQAIDYFKAHSAKTEQDIVNEVDRYIAWPGQALAYKIGQIRISQMRQRAEATLGARFDLRAFNDAILETGSVPLPALETRMATWLAAQASTRER